jgi:hypothetical protein
MNKLIYTTLAAGLIATSAQAQTATTPTAPAPAPTVTTTVPMGTPTAKMPDAGAPLPGSNSFTEAQATARIVELGYTDVKGLGKDSAGVWRGTAMKDGKSQNVALDFKGNIVVGQN